MWPKRPHVLGNGRVEAAVTMNFFVATQHIFSEFLLTTHGINSA